MEQVTINSNLYERVYKEIEDYGRASYNHCPGIRLYSHYKEHLINNIIDLGSGTGETVKFFREQGIEADGMDWIKPRNKYCKKANITKKHNLQQYDTATNFDVIEHLSNEQVKNLFINMSACKSQIFTIANTPSIVKLKNGTEVDLHINKKPFGVWRGIILDYFDIIKEIKI
ncbi:MAG: methyltransferase domain-containing protein, partial [Candidatus Heimdallarchaeota archaeon]